MSLKKQRNPLYNHRRYWYHISTTLKNKYVNLIPWDEVTGMNRSGAEPEGKRICVSPTIEQCLTAIPYYLSQVSTIYRTKSKVKAHKPRRVFDAQITKEGWLLKPTSFIKIGVLHFSDIEKKLNIDNVIEECASAGDYKTSRKVLKWWNTVKVKRFVKKA